MLLFFFHHNILAICQDLKELPVGVGLNLSVVDLHAVVQVDVQAVVGQVAELLGVVGAFFGLFTQLFLLLLGTGDVPGQGGAFDDGIHALLLAVQLLLHPLQVLCPDIADGVGVPAVHIDQGFEAVLLSGIKEPVDGAFLVDFLVVFEEIGEEVIADHFPAGVPFVAQGIGNELEIFLQGIQTFTKATNRLTISSSK